MCFGGDGDILLKPLVSEAAILRILLIPVHEAEGTRNTVDRGQRQATNDRARQHRSEPDATGYGDCGFDIRTRLRRLVTRGRSL